MKTVREDFLKICQTEKGVLVLMVANLLLAIILIIFSIINFNPNAAVIKIGYGDIGGYRDGTWIDILTFPLLALVFGIFHSILALRIFHKRGSGMTKLFLLVTTMLLLGTFLVLSRIFGGR